jgi:hypothetical protein
MRKLKRLRAERTPNGGRTLCERCAEVCDRACRTVASRARIEMRAFDAGAIRL